MTVNSELFEIHLLRSSVPYHAAEVLRRQTIGGAAAMAAAGETTQEYAAVRLLVSTWETIALRVKGNTALKIPFCENNPVGHMWDALWPGIKIIRGNAFRTKAAGTYYAREFQLLNGTYRRWLNTKPASYQTAALEGINAQFG
jgi:hypothetical protein